MQEMMKMTKSKMMFIWRMEQCWLKMCVAGLMTASLQQENLKCLRTQHGLGLQDHLFSVEYMVSMSIGYQFIFLILAPI